MNQAVRLSITVEKGEAMKAVLSLCRSCIYGNKVHGDCGIGPEKLECEKYNPKNSPGKATWMATVMKNAMEEVGW